MMNNAFVKTLFRVISLALTLSVFYFAYRYVATLIQNGELSSLTIRWDMVIVAAFLFFISYLIFAFHWLRVGKTIDTTANKQQLLAFFASQPYKYLPTSLFLFSFRAKYAKQAGMSVKNSSLTQLVENVNRIGSGFVTGALFYSLSQSFLLFFTLILIFVLLYVFTPKLVRIGFKKREKYFNKSEIAINFLLAVTSWIIAGVAFWLVGFSLGYAPQLLIFIAANSVANVVGTLALFAPGGIGIRELVLIFFSVANPIIVVWRLVTFVCDIVFGFGAILLLKLVAKR